MKYKINKNKNKNKNNNNYRGDSRSFANNSSAYKVPPCIE
jgi:hypothetical protein